MTATAITTLLGGIGLFLLGMGLMTDSLQALGGDALRRILRTLTRSRVYGLLTGAAVTATVQSSTATTLATVGFVSAGLLTFSQAIPLIFGANIGTTSTAWIVAQLGLQVKVSTVALPMVGVGALLRLATRGRRARLGLAISGFGLVFVGIDVMQAGMAELDLDLTPSGGSGTWSTTLALVGGGIAMTVVMQSSTAAVTTTLVALHAGSITLEQAAALVIGQNVGTTLTAILGAIGANVAARRAALAHAMFNVGTGLVALALIRPFLAIVQSIGAWLADDSPETALAAFHTAFNVLGVALFFPFTSRFAWAIERIVPERKTPALERLSAAMLELPAVALEAARKSVAQVAAEVVRLAVGSLRAAASTDDDRPVWRRALRLLEDPRAILDGADPASRELADALRNVARSTEALSDYVASIRTASDPPGLREEHVELVHALDHLHRLVREVEQEDERERVGSDDGLRALAVAVADDLEASLEGASVEADGVERAAAALHEVVRRDHERREVHRSAVLERVAEGGIAPAEADPLLKTARWIGKLPDHAHRIALHLAWTAGAPPVPGPDES